MRNLLSGQLFAIVLSVLAVLCQVILAPYIQIGLAMPNFILATILVLSVLFPSSGMLLYAFILGLIYNLLGEGAVGSMAFCLVAISFILIFASEISGSLRGSLGAIALVIACLATEILYALFVVIFTEGMSLIDMILLKALPCALYDLIIAIVLYILLGVLAGGSARRQDGPSFR